MQKTFEHLLRFSENANFLGFIILSFSIAFLNLCVFSKCASSIVFTYNDAWLCVYVVCFDVLCCFGALNDNYNFSETVSNRQRHKTPRYFGTNIGNIPRISTRRPPGICGLSRHHDSIAVLAVVHSRRNDLPSVVAIRPTSGVTMGWLLRLVTGAPLVVGGPRQF